MRRKRNRERQNEGAREIGYFFSYTYSEVLGEIFKKEEIPLRWREIDEALGTSGDIPCPAATEIGETILMEVASTCRVRNWGLASFNLMHDQINLVLVVPKAIPEMEMLMAAKVHYAIRQRAQTATSRVVQGL